MFKIKLGKVNKFSDFEYNCKNFADLNVNENLCNFVFDTKKQKSKDLFFLKSSQIKNTIV